MTKTHGYILVLDTQQRESHNGQFLLTHLRCPVFMADTAEQAVKRAQQVPPYLVILVGDGHGWSQSLVNQLRQEANSTEMTIVALTDAHSPHWDHYENNPGLDGFLVKPLSGEVLTSLVESALAKQNWI